MLHVNEGSQRQSLVFVVPFALRVQHTMPACAGWTANNSSAANATIATATIESDLLNDRLPATRWIRPFISCPPLFANLSSSACTGPNDSATSARSLET